jgi:hypothetical protein
VIVVAEVIWVGEPGAAWLKSIAASEAQVATGVTTSAAEAAFAAISPLTAAVTDGALAALDGVAFAGAASWKLSSTSPAIAMNVAVRKADLGTRRSELRRGRGIASPLSLSHEPKESRRAERWA